MLERASRTDGRTDGRANWSPLRRRGAGWSQRLQRRMGEAGQGGRDEGRSISRCILQSLEICMHERNAYMRACAARRQTDPTNTHGSAATESDVRIFAMAGWGMAGAVGVHDSWPRHESSAFSCALDATNTVAHDVYTRKLGNLSVHRGADHRGRVAPRTASGTSWIIGPGDQGGRMSRCASATQSWHSWIWCCL